MFPGFYSEQRTYTPPPQTIAVANFDGEIWQVDFSGQKGQQVGVDMKTYQELLDVANQYKQALIDHGLLEKEKTSEDILAEQTELITRLANAVRDLSREVEAIKTNGSQCNSQYFAANGNQYGQGEAGT